MLRPVLRLASVLALAALFLGVAVAQPRPAERLHRVTYLTGGSQASRTGFLDAFRQGMRELGYVEGANFQLEARFAEGDFRRLRRLAEELVADKPDVIFVSTTPASLAVKAATKRIPVVFIGVADPLGVGLVRNLARPEANITGVTNIVAELTGKRMALLKELVPSVSRIALLLNPDDPNAGVQMTNAREAARALGLELAPVLHIRRASDLERVFETATRSEVKAALRLVDPTITMLRSETAALAGRHRLAIVYPFREDAEAGGLASYGPSLPGQYRQAASFVDKLLRGARPGDLPVEQPARFELVINLKTADALGLSVPASLRLQADRLIE